jgi:hypothetical protein
MVVPIKAGNHVSFAPMQVLYDLINSKITDINAERRANSGQWVFPTVPEAEDENYPRIAILNNGINYTEYGAGRFIQENYSGGQATDWQYGRIATLPVIIAVFVKKKQRHEADYFDGTSHVLTNTKQSDYLGEKIAKLIEMYRSVYFIPNGMDVKVTGITRSYDDSQFLIAKNISIEVVMFDKWGYDFTDPSYDEGWINNIDLTITVV